MSEDGHEHDIACNLIRRHGRLAAEIAERRAEAHRVSGEREGEDMWRGIAAAVRSILFGRRSTA